MKQESLTNAKVSTRQQCVYEAPRNLVANQRKEHNLEE